MLVYSLLYKKLQDHMQLDNWKFISGLNKNIFLTYQDYIKRKYIIPCNHLQRNWKLFNFSSLEICVHTTEWDKVIPPQITMLKVCNDDWKGMPLDFITSSVRTIVMGLSFNNSLDKLPDTVTRIYFPIDSAFNQRVDNLPANLEEMCFGDAFNQPIDLLPSKLKRLKLGRNFNHKVDKLPDKLDSLFLEDTSPFNYPINNLPKNLTVFRVGNSFNQPIDNLPPNLIYITIGNSFNQPIKRFPPQLRSFKLSFQSRFNHPLTNLPSTIKTVSLGAFFDHMLDDIPSTLRTLDIVLKDCSKPIISSLPSQLINLVIGGNLNQTLCKLPATILLLDLQTCGNIRIPLTGLPPNLKQLTLPKNINHDISNIPNSIESLKMSLFIDQQFEHLPTHLKQLYYVFDHTLPPDLADVKDKLKAKRPSCVLIPIKEKESILINPL